MRDAAAKRLQWGARVVNGEGHRGRTGLDYGSGPEGPNDDCADARADGDERGAGTEMAAMFDRLREAAAAHDMTGLNDIAALS
jgi:hypothetical protein